MKFRFSNLIRQFRSKSFPLLLGLILYPLAGIAADSIFINNGAVNNGNLTQVDATNFVNNGTWNIITAHYIYEPSDVLNYTNEGSMTGSPGWNFDFNPVAPGGQRGLSAIFFNDNTGTNNTGTIQATDGEIFNPINSQTLITASYLLVSATNIINKGTLEASASGEIVLTGQNVLLARSFLEINPIVGVGSSNGSTNFTPDTAIYDEYWSQANSNKLTVFGSPWNGTTVGGFTFSKVQEPCEVTTNTEQIGPFIPSVADSYAANLNPFQLTTTNSSGTPNPPMTVYSNEVHQAIFVFVGDSNIVATVRFGLMLSPTNFFLPMAAQLLTVSTNTVTETLQTNALYVIDDLAAVGTNGALVKNAVISPSALCTDPTFRPDSVVVSRIDPGTFAAGSPGMGSPASTFFYDPATFSNFVATGRADCYSALVDNLAAEPPPGESISNAPGRIHIYANDLDLSKTRMSAQAEIVIQATNLISSLGAAMDSQNLSYNLGSTNGSLNVVNLAVQNVQRLHGTINEWSGLWTNYMVNIYTNNFVTNAISGGFISSPLTNTVEVDLAMTVVDAGALRSTTPVTVQDLILHSTNITVSDSMNVTNTLLFDGLSLTIQGELTVPQNWESAIAPTLRFFTNNGDLNIPNEAHFGDDRTLNYAAFVNHGSIFSGGQTINSDYLEINGGTDNASAADFTASCQTGLVMNADITVGGDIQFFANTLQIDPSILSAGGAINFTVTNSLSDGGSAIGNLFTCQNGFNLLIKPATGGLLGTTITDIAQGQDEVDHVWAGLDFGTNAAGYLNNAAIGTLILNQAAINGFIPLFHFSGANTGNGLYVGSLDLSTLTDFTNAPEIANELEIDPNLVIYFVSAKLNPNVVIAPFPSAEAFLDGQLGGHLRWVQGVTLPTTAITTISGSMISGGKFQFNITNSSGSSNQTNIIQVSTNLLSWVPIYTNIGSMSFTDPAANIFPYRFYRVETLP